LGIRCPGRFPTMVRQARIFSLDMDVA